MISSRTWIYMEWLRLVSSLKLYVSFAKEPYKKDEILQKRPIIWRSVLIIATPYVKRHRVKELCILSKGPYIHTNTRTHTRTHMHIYYTPVQPRVAIISLMTFDMLFLYLFVLSCCVRRALFRTMSRCSVRCNVCCSVRCNACCSYDIRHVVLVLVRLVLLRA